MNLPDTQDDQPQPIPAVKLKKILLVEDDNNLADVYSTRLISEGFDILRVADGEEALAAAIKYKPDLVLLDIMMPKVSGYDVLDILRKTPETANLKIIIVTARGQDADRQRADELGADDYLVKSQVIIADLVERVKQHLGVD
jgi:DNA-binding response OmpR family regulator